jgi:predicted nucleotidyltransferase
MDPVIKEKWINALRSGEYKQGKGCLYNGESFCCLGVLFDIMTKENPTKYYWGDKRFFEKNKFTYIPNNDIDSSGIVLPNFLVEDKDIDIVKYGSGFLFGPYVEDSLWWLNDQNVSFNEIADIIEEKIT